MSTAIGSIFFGRRLNVKPPISTFTARGLRMEDGTQLLGTPANSVIANFHLQAGASFDCPWAAIRGAVIKLSELRSPVNINGRLDDRSIYKIPAGHFLMDEGCLTMTVNLRNKYKAFPFEKVSGLAKEDLFLVHASYAEPNNIFLPQGKYARTDFRSETLKGINHMLASGQDLYLLEEELSKIAEERPINILNLMNILPKRIIVLLRNGGHIILKENEQ